MNKRALYFTVICLYLSFSGFAQVYEDFNLSEYVTPDIVRSQLDFSLRTAGSFTDNETSKNDLFRINGDLNTAFDKYKNTRPYWNRQLLVVGMSGNYRNEMKEKNSDYGLTFNYQNVNRFYTSDMRFFEVSPSVDVQLLGYKTGGLLVDVKTHNNSYYANIPMSVGKGRIEQVEDARQAIYILENLDKQGVLNRKLTTEEIHAFAQTISTVKNKRFLDARLRMIDEITTVDSVLVNMGVLSSGGAPYFTTLYDYWMYGDLFSRGSGTVYKVGLTPFINHRNYNNVSDLQSVKLTGTGVTAKLSYENEKPLNLYWQQSIWAEASGSYWHSKINLPSDNTSHMVDMGLNGRYTLGYYPTSRTNVNFGFDESLYWGQRTYKDTPEPNDKYTFLTSYTGAFVDLYYYISPQFRFALNANLGLRYTDNIKPKQDDPKNLMWTGNFVAKLTYSLF